jgi:hypothetical protein
MILYIRNQTAGTPVQQQIGKLLDVSMSFMKVVSPNIEGFALPLRAHSPFLVTLASLYHEADQGYCRGFTGRRCLCESVARCQFGEFRCEELYFWGLGYCKRSSAVQMFYSTGMRNG